MQPIHCKSITHTAHHRILAETNPTGERWKSGLRGPRARETQMARLRSANVKLPENKQWHPHDAKQPPSDDDGTDIVQATRHLLLHDPAHTHARTTLLSATHAAHPQAHEPPTMTLRFLLNNRGTHRQVEAVESAVAAFMLATMGAPI